MTQRQAGHLMAVVVAGIIAASGCWKRAYTPPAKQVMDQGQESRPAPAYDLWGRSISEAEARQMDPAALSPANGAVKIDKALLDLGRKAFYEETFGNDIFLTDVMGILDGPITPAGIAAACASLKGEGTANLRVKLARDANVGGRQFHKGEEVDTGPDVPRGAALPMGMTIKQVGPRVYAGVTCALCHSSVDPDSHQVIHGAPNTDLRAGLLLAMGTNSAAFFTHADVKDLAALNKDPGRTVETSDGTRAPLPDVEALERAVDAALLKWPPGGFDSMTDLVANPSQLPTAWTYRNHPYSFSGAFTAGPFAGLSVQNNNVHALNSDALTEADAAPKRFHIDTEVFVATVLQNAALPKYRYDPKGGQRPSAFFESVDPTPGQPGMNQLVALPTYPKATLVEPTSLWNSSPGFPVWQQVNAMSAWQNTLRPPRPTKVSADDATKQRGRAVFERARCATCHAGPTLTNNRVIRADEIKTQPIRAKGMMNTQFAFERQPLAYAFDQSVPLPPNPRTIPVPVDRIDWAQVTLAYGWGDSPGGYKVPALVGLYWTAPYLHDGGVAVGTDESAGAGVANCVLNGKGADPMNSLKAVIDRGLRKRVIDANHANADLSSIGVEGIGHEFWVDAGAGYSADDQKALILYLLTYESPE